MKTAISIPDHVCELAEELARRLSISRSELYTRAVEAYVRSHRDEAVTDALNEAYATNDSSVEPVIAGLQFASIPKEEYG